MDYLKIYLFNLILINVASLLSISYLYGENNQTFKIGKRLSINISFRNFGELFLLYAIDSDGYRLLITYSNKQININFNGHLINRTVIYHPDSINNFEMLFKFENKHFEYILQNPDPFQNYPIPKDYRTKKNKTYFWLGNIGPYIGDENRKYEPFENPTFGCLHYLYVNFKSLIYNNYGDYFSKSCEQNLKKTNCLKENCSEISVKENFINCSFHAVTANRNCYFDLIKFDGQERSFKRIYDSTHESTSLKFIWQQKLSEQFCLIGLILKNGSSLLFYTNERNQLEMCFQAHSSENCSRKILFNATINSIHVLLITFEHPHFIIKISDGKYIRNIIESFPGQLSGFIIGFIHQENICRKFEGKLAFRYEASQFKSVCSRSIIEQIFKILFWIVLIFIGIGLFLIAICINSCCCIKKENTKETAIVYNFYEGGNIQERNLPTLPPTNDENDDAIYTTVGKYEII